VQAGQTGALSSGGVAQADASSAIPAVKIRIMARRANLNGRRGG